MTYTGIPLVRQVRGSIRWRLTKQKASREGIGGHGYLTEVTVTPLFTCTSYLTPSILASSCFQPSPVTTRHTKHQHGRRRAGDTCPRERRSRDDCDDDDHHHHRDEPHSWRQQSRSGCCELGGMMCQTEDHRRREKEQCVLNRRRNTALPIALRVMPPSAIPMRA